MGEAGVERPRRHGGAGWAVVLKQLNRLTRQ